MGKKKKSEEKRGKAQEKAAHKADKKQKSKKGDGEEDFDAILEEIRQIDLQRTRVTETKCPPPGPRCFCSLVAHPEKQELLLFGGEYFDGKSMRCYNDLFIYNIKQDEWSTWVIPSPPSPRSSHQAACVPQGGGQMWVFGGEFTSTNNESFHHFKDLWMLDLARAKWENVKAVGGPSSRSGHRMVVSNRHLVIFGGFHEGSRDFLYFNDVYAFSLQARQWHRINIAGGPSPRSAASVSTSPQGALLVMGGYSRQKVKRDGAQKSVVLSDAWSLVPLDTASLSSSSTADASHKSAASSSSKKSSSSSSSGAGRWKWVKLNPTGRGPSPRSGASTVQLSEQRAVLFGGAEDLDSDDRLQSQFLADMYQLATDGKPPRWFEVNVDELSRQVPGAKPKRRRKKKVPAADGDGAAATAGEADGDDTETDTESEEENEDTGSKDEEAMVSSDSASAAATAEADNSGSITVHADSVFTCVMKTNTTSTVDAGSSSAAASATKSDDADTAALAACSGPTPRISSSLAAKGGTVFVYGGLFEKGDRQIYLDDMYSLELVRRSGSQGGWKCLVPLRSDALPWLEEEEDEDDDDDDDEEEDEDEDGEDDDGGDDDSATTAAGSSRPSRQARGEQSDDEADDDDDDDDSSDDIAVLEGEGMGEFYIRTKEQWLERATDAHDAEHGDDDDESDERDRAIKALAFQLAKTAHKAAQ